MIDLPLLDELRERLVGAFGDRLHVVVLFGSERVASPGRRVISTCWWCLIIRSPTMVMNSNVD